VPYSSLACRCVWVGTCCLRFRFDARLPRQALDESDRIALLDDSFGSISGIVTKYGLGSYSQQLEHGSVKEISSAMIKEICEEEEEEQGLALQRNREAREVRKLREAVMETFEF
jgi:hypothetical protein